MVDVKNKVVFLIKPVGSIDKPYKISTNIQGQLKKKVIKVKKLKIAEDIKVEISGNYKEFEVKIEPEDSKHASRILAMLQVKR